MTAPDSAYGRPVLAAFIVWFAHFMLCWTVVEIWPHQWRANLLAWGFTAIALAVMGVLFVRLDRWAARGERVGFTRRTAHGAIAIATVAVLFTAFPSVVFLPSDTSMLPKVGSSTL